MSDNLKESPTVEQAQSKYPEHDKLQKIKNASQTCGQFIEWLRDEKGIHLAMWYGDADTGEYLDYAGYRMGSINKILAEFFGIDYDKLEAEKEQMYKELVAFNQKQQEGN